MNYQTLFSFFLQDKKKLAIIEIILLNEPIFFLYFSIV